MLESLVEWMSYPLYYAIDGAAPPPRTGASHATIYPYGPFPSGDGKTVMLGLQNEREWSIFCERVLLRPELAADPRYASNSKRSAARARWRDVGSPAGDIPALLPPGMGPDSTPQWGAVPALGQHSDAILASLGFSAEKIAALRAAVAV